jgi:hypothetical protein
LEIGQISPRFVNPLQSAKHGVVYMTQKLPAGYSFPGCKSIAASKQGDSHFWRDRSDSHLWNKARLALLVSWPVRAPGALWAAKMRLSATFFRSTDRFPVGNLIFL